MIMNYLYENQPIRDTKLKEYINNNQTLHPYFENGFYTLKPKNICGFLSLKDESYFIVPKIVNGDANEKNLDIFLYMLLYAYDIQLKNEDIFSASNKQRQLFEVFIRLFADTLLDEFKRGVFKQYITMQENLRFLRGKYLIEKNFANFHRQNIFCEFDEFSIDNPLNRFFLYAIKIFKKFSHYPNLHRCEAILDEVTPNTFNIDTLQIHFDRMNSRYKKSFEVAMMILHHLIPTTNSANEKSFAFLFDMSEVFEKFVAKILQDIDPTTKIQHQKNFGNLQLKPDIVTDTLIIDTKYKTIQNKDDLATADKYQMFAYGTNFKRKDVMLLYPKHLKDVKEDLQLGKDNDTIYLQMRSLDLSYYGEYSGFIEEMKKRLEKLI